MGYYNLPELIVNRCCTGIKYFGYIRVSSRKYLYLNNFMWPLGMKGSTAHVSIPTLSRDVKIKQKQYAKT